MRFKHQEHCRPKRNLGSSSSDLKNWLIFGIIIKNRIVYKEVKWPNDTDEKQQKLYCNIYYYYIFLHALLKSLKSMVSSKNKQSHITHDSLGFGDK